MNSLPIVCSGDHDSIEAHICPYKSEIEDDNDTLCTCCEVCEQNCKDDI